MSVDILTSRREPAALGVSVPLPPRTRRLRLLVAASLVVVLAVLRVIVSGPAGPGPSEPGVTVVTPQLLRGGVPDDHVLGRLAAKEGVGAVVNLGSPIIAEQAVTSALGQAYLESPVAAGRAPTWLQLAAIARLAARTTARREAVYVHDDSGGGRAVATTAMLLVLRGAPLEQALGGLSATHRRSMTNAQVLALGDLAAQLSRAPGTSRSGPYARAHVVAW